MAKRAYLHFIHEPHRYFFIQQKALELNLKGKCQISQNRQLEVEVEGKTKAVNEFIQFIKKGYNSSINTNSFTVEIFDELKGYTTMETNLV